MGEKRSLLIVDDKEDDLLALETLLTEYFPDVMILKTTKVSDSIDMVVKEQVNGALIALQMPEMDGIELCRTLKADERTCHTPVILLTSHETVPELMAKGLDAGADDFIHRPFNNVEFVARVKVMLRVNSAESELRQMNEQLELLINRRTKELRVSEEKYRFLFENAPLPYQSLDENGHIIDVNPAWLRTLGYNREEIIGTFIGNIVHPDWLPYLEKKFPEFKRTGSVHNAQYKLRHKDGHYLYISLDGRIGYRPDGDFRQTHCVFQDITRRKRVEEALRADERRLASIYDTVGDVIFLLAVEADEQYRFSSINQAFSRVTGLPMEMVVGKLVNEVISETSLSLVLEKYKEAIEENTIVRWEEESDYPTGRLVGEVSIAPVYDDEGNCTHLVGSVHDITERKLMEIERDQLQSQLLQSQKIESIGRLAGGVAHDYNNMLGVILGRAEMVLAKMDKDDPNRGSMEAIMRAGKRSADLTRQLLAFARKQTIQPRVLDLNDTIEHMLKMLLQVIGENIELDWQPGNGLWTVEMDPVQVDQILANLCVNARDALSERGTITIETANKTIDESYCAVHPGSTPGRYVMLAVSDDGCGMDEETRSHIFDPFFTTKGVGEGTGLGLSTVYGIVKQNNGFINVYSEPGEGTTFRIYIPMYEGEITEKTETVVSEIPHGTGQRILLVEDEVVLLEMAKTMLEELGYQVHTASLPAEALSYLQANTSGIDLLITDVVMPGMSGKDLAEEVRRLCRDVKVLFMSGYTANAIAHHGVLDKDVAFIQKPFSLLELGQKVREVLNNS